MFETHLNHRKLLNTVAIQEPRGGRWHRLLVLKGAELNISGQKECTSSSKRTTTHGAMLGWVLRGLKQGGQKMFLPATFDMVSFDELSAMHRILAFARLMCKWINLILVLTVSLIPKP